MFFGTFNHQLDDKGRLRLPAKLRDELGMTFFCMRGLDDNIFVYRANEFAKQMAKFDSIAINDVNAQRAWSELISTAFEIQTDSQGRFVLPQPLKESAGIEKNIVIKGVINRIEIWSEKRNNARQADKGINDLYKDLGI